MKNGKKVIATRMIEQNLELYDSFFDHRWAIELSSRIPARLDDAFDSLCMAWKEAANTHRLPWLMIEQMVKFADGYLKVALPKGQRLVDAVKARLVSEIGDSLTRDQRKKLTAAIKRMDQQIRISDQERDTRVPAQAYWQNLIGASEFQFSVCGSQGLAYCGLVFAYEWFVVNCFRALGGDHDLRPSGKPFWAECKKLLVGDPKLVYWDDKPVWIAREARNCIAHLGGKAKPTLIAERPKLFISAECIISVQPADNRDLFEVLKAKVTQLVGEVTPKLAVTA